MSTYRTDPHYTRTCVSCTGGQVIVEGPGYSKRWVDCPDCYPIEIPKMTNSEQHMKAALDSGVTPDQFRAEYEKRQSTAVSVHTDDISISYRPSTSGVVVEVFTRGLESGNGSGLTLSPASAIRWGESLAAAGRKAQES